MKQFNHREAIGGKWDEIGDLQFNFLRNNGLEESSFLLDIGCGSLRGGARFIKYLEPLHYFALEKEEDILKAGIENELKDISAEKAAFFYNLTGDFEIPNGWPQFNFMLAQSVFTHLLPEQIEFCLTQVKSKLSGAFFATYFDSPKIDLSTKHGWRKNERSVAKYPFKMFEELGETAGYKVEKVYYDHPRGQKMLKFTIK